MKLGVIKGASQIGPGNYAGMVLTIRIAKCEHN